MHGTNFKRRFFNFFQLLLRFYYKPFLKRIVSKGCKYDVKVKLFCRIAIFRKNKKKQEILGVKFQI